MSLHQYRQKRHFKKTSEPYGSQLISKGQQFVIHKHAASHLHYDLRLQMSGVLKSWAVPKGPSLDPTVKRLAVQVEDHPVEYGKFEGIIPAGEYGGGTVMLWDQGQWYPQGDGEQAYKKGALTFELKGEKLKGCWKLIRLKNDPKNWLLIKIKDEQSRSQKSYDVTIEEDLSVLTQRTMEEIKKNFAPKNEKKPIADKKTSANTEKEQQRALTHPSRILFTEGKITKLQLAQYYEKIADWILPYVINRPLTVVRCPQGQEKKCFIQRHVSAGMSKGILGFNDDKQSEPYLYIKKMEGLLALVQMNILEIHTWGARVDKIDSPDVMIFDLDPGPGVEWEDVISAAFEVKQELAEFSLESFVKTTGSKGLHVAVPLQRRHSWDEVRNFSHQFSQYLENKHPERYTSTSSKVKREGKIFIDYIRNNKGATAVAPYSTRAKPNASVATPLAWEELSARVRSDYYHIKNLPRRLANLKHDPWENFFKIKQKLPSIDQ